MLRTLISISAKCGAATAITLGLGVGYVRYTHPDLNGRATPDLRVEVMKLGKDNVDLPIALRLPSIVRQEYISNELAQREQKQILEWQEQEVAANQGLASAENGRPQVAR